MGRGGEVAGKNQRGNGAVLMTIVGKKVQWIQGGKSGGRYFEPRDNSNLFTGKVLEIVPIGESMYAAIRRHFGEPRADAVGYLLADVSIRWDRVLIRRDEPSKIGIEYATPMLNKISVIKPKAFA